MLCRGYSNRTRCGLVTSNLKTVCKYTQGPNMPQSVDFPAGELKRALAEQVFGIESSAMTSDAPNASGVAECTIHLLEGTFITVTLDERGYHLVILSSFLRLRTCVNVFSNQLDFGRDRD